MIEVNLYSIAAGDGSARAGKCIARNRFDREAMGVSVEEFVKEFLKENLDKFEGGIGSPEVVSLLDDSVSRKDLACINHLLIRVGYKFQVTNVADDEENATGVPDGEIIEWNVIDHNFIQNGYPTATKLIPGPGEDIPEILRTIVEQSRVFAAGKFSGIKNPFTELLNNLDYIKKISGDVSSTLTSKVFQYLDEMGIEIFCAQSEY